MSAAVFRWVPLCADRACLRDANWCVIHRDDHDVAAAALAARHVTGMVDGSSLLAVLVPAAASVAGRGPVGIEMRMRWRGARETMAASPGARESMMLRPGPSYSPAAYFSADYDRYTDFARVESRASAGCRLSRRASRRLAVV